MVAAGEVPDVVVVPDAHVEVIPAAARLAVVARRVHGERVSAAPRSIVFEVGAAGSGPGAAVVRPVNGAVAARVDATFEREAAEGTRRRRRIDPVHTMLYPRELAARGAGLEPEGGEFALLPELAAARHLPRRGARRRRRAKIGRASCRERV